MKYMLVLFLAGIVSITNAEVVEKDLPEEKRTDEGLYLTAKEAFALVQSNKDKILFIDVRSRAEVATVGMPTSADVNIPLLEFNSEFHWDSDAQAFPMQMNEKFVQAVNAQLSKKGLSKDSQILLICRSGNRSARAANLLLKAGYTKVYSVVDGFEGDTVKTGADQGKRLLNGWKNNGLPWSYQLDSQKMFCPEQQYFTCN